ncbi:MAG: DUF4236 domain-containing protein [Bacteroidales bacterium]|nr:DUF4236 domain-containing protein [Bacteroidales bacterium]
MGSTRFRKSKKILPGVKVNVTKTGVGLSVGGKLGGVSVNSHGDMTTRVSAPGTGLSYVEREGKSKREARKEAQAAEKAAKKQAKKDARAEMVSSIKSAVLGEAKCAACGAELTDGAKFCGSCGAKVGK